MPFADVEVRRAYQRDYYRQRQIALYRRYRSAGGCGECGVPSGDFARCLTHRLRLALRKRLWRKKPASPAHVAAARANGKLGGRPRKPKW